MQVVYTLRQGRDHPDDAVFSESGAMNVMFFMDKARAARRPPRHCPVTCLQTRALLQDAPALVLCNTSPVWHGFAPH
jgi:hypothetical protein